jgi:hypothetical protein
MFISVRFNREVSTDPALIRPTRLRSTYQQPPAPWSMEHASSYILRHTAERGHFSSNKRKAAEPVTFPVDTVEEAARGVG